MGWLIFWAVVIGYWAGVVHFVPVYFRRLYAAAEKQYGRYWDSSHYKTLSRSYHQKECFWDAVGMAVFWLWYEAFTRFRDWAIYSLTSEERKAKELAQARKIIAEYEREQYNK